MIARIHLVPLVGMVVFLYFAIFFVGKSSFFTITIMMGAICLPAIQCVFAIHKDKEDIIDAMRKDCYMRSRIMVRDIIHATIVYIEDKYIDEERSKRLQRQWSSQVSTDNINVLKMQFELIYQNQFMYTNEASDIIVCAYKLIRKIESCDYFRGNNPYKYLAQMRSMEQEFRRISGMML